MNDKDMLKSVAVDRELYDTISSCALDYADLMKQNPHVWTRRGVRFALFQATCAAGCLEQLLGMDSEGERSNDNEKATTDQAAYDQVREILEKRSDDNERVTIDRVSYEQLREIGSELDQFVDNDPREWTRRDVQNALRSAQTASRMLAECLGKQLQVAEDESEDIGCSGHSC